MVARNSSFPHFLVWIFCCFFPFHMFFVMRGPLRPAGLFSKRPAGLKVDDMRTDIPVWKRAMPAVLGLVVYGGFFIGLFVYEQRRIDSLPPGQKPVAVRTPGGFLYMGRLEIITQDEYDRLYERGQVVGRTLLK